MKVIRSFVFVPDSHCRKNWSLSLKISKILISADCIWFIWYFTNILYPATQSDTAICSILGRLWCKNWNRRRYSRLTHFNHHYQLCSGLILTKFGMEVWKGCTKPGKKYFTDSVYVCGLKRPVRVKFVQKVHRHTQNYIYG